MVVSHIIEQVRHALEQLGTDCAMEDVVGLCPELTWNQVFWAVDYLSRTGQVRVTIDKNRTYRVQAARVETSERSYASISQEIHAGEVAPGISRPGDQSGLAERKHMPLG
jgi:ribosomal protein L3